MIDWSAVFDEAYPAPGAKAVELGRFAAVVGRPLSRTEVEEINRGRRNPFPKGDPLYASWRPFDASRWALPGRPLPASYLSLLAWSDGREFRTGERWFQFLPALDPVHGVRAMTLAYHLPEYMPGALPLALNGGGTFYLLDMRRPSLDGEYPIVCSRCGNLGWDADECARVADTLLDACSGIADVDSLL